MGVVMGCRAWVSELAAGANENEETTKVERPTFPDGRLLWHTMTPETFFFFLFKSQQQSDDLLWL
jgi:hypothetical protein